MRITQFSSRKFNQDVSQAKKATLQGPVFITDRGHVAHVLLTIEMYQKLIGKTQRVVDLLGMPDAAEVDFEPPKLKGKLFKTEGFD